MEGWNDVIVFNVFFCFYYIFINKRIYGKINVRELLCWFFLYDVVKLWLEVIKKLKWREEKFWEISKIIGKVNSLVLGSVFDGVLMRNCCYVENNKVLNIFLKLKFWFILVVEVCFEVKFIF